MLLSKPKTTLSQETKETLSDLEASIVKKIDRLRAHYELEDEDFTAFQTERVYPYLRIIIKKFLDYVILKKLEDIAAHCEMSFVLGKISSCLANLERKLFKSNNMHGGGSQGLESLEMKVFEGGGVAGGSRGWKGRFFGGEKGKSLRKGLFGRERVGENAGNLQSKIFFISFY